MSRVLDLVQLEAAVLALAEKRLPISARRLAREAMVAPATLYGQISGIDEAIDLGQAAVARSAVPRLAGAVRSGHFTELAFWINREPGHAGLFFNPTRAGGVPDLDADLNVARVVIGGVLAYSSTDSSTELRRRIVAALAQVPDRSPIPSRVHELPITAETLIEDVWSETRRLIAETSDRTEIRIAATDLLQRDDLEGWTFRQVAEMTGEPLAAIHRHGSRAAQLAQAVSDFADGLITVTRSWATDEFDGVEIAFDLLSLAPGMLAALAEVVGDRLRTGAVPLIIINDRVTSAVQAQIGLTLSRNASQSWVSATR